jgi:hypothetical protein
MSRYATSAALELLLLRLTVGELSHTEKSPGHVLLAMCTGISLIKAIASGGSCVVTANFLFACD